MNDVVVVNEKDEVIGTMSREQSHLDGTPHRIVVVYVENSFGQILVQVRMSGDFDHSSAGHVDPGESYLEAARRELKEELGIENVELVSIGKGISKETKKDKNRTHVFEVFLCTAEPKSLQSDEVHKVFWSDPEDILKLMQDSPNDEKYCGGFRVSLSIYLKYKKKIN